MLMANERYDFLLKEKLEIIQNDDVFSFSTDALLLAHFTKVKKKDVIMDLCSGNGVIPLLLSHKGNQFIECGYNLSPNSYVINIWPENHNEVPNYFVHENIVIENNLFKIFDTPILRAKSTKGLIFKNSLSEIKSSNTPSGLSPLSFTSLEE